MARVSPPIGVAVGSLPRRHRDRRSVGRRRLATALALLSAGSLACGQVALAEERSSNSNRGSSNNNAKIVGSGAAGLAIGLIIGGALSQQSGGGGSSYSGGRAYRSCASRFGPGAANSSSDPSKCVCRSGYTWGRDGGQQRCVARGGGGDGDRSQSARASGATPTYGSDDIEKIQEALNILGYDAGEVDGSLGRKSQQAIRKYQEDKGYPKTGALAAAEMTVLMSDVEAMRQAKQKVGQPSAPPVNDAITRPQDTPKLDPRTELAHWESVRDTRIAAELEDYIARYPSGQFSRLAQIRLDQLKAGQARGDERERSVRPAKAETPVAKGTELPAIDEAAYPRARQKKRDGVAVIIGNRTYQNGVPPVDYAIRDAEEMRVLAVRTLGIDGDNVIFIKDATRGALDEVFGSEKNHRGRLWRLIDPDGNSDVTIFYAGHGVPGTAGTADTNFLLPVDGDPNHPTLNGYPLTQLYRNLSELKAKSITVFIDACFSGQSADPTGAALIKHASPIFVTQATPSDSSKLNVFAAAGERQLASWDTESGHGIFTRYILSGLAGEADDDRNKEVSSKELYDYVKRQVRRLARRSYGREQEPQFSGNWNEVLAAY